MQSTVSFSHRRSIGDSADRMPEVLRHYWSQHERVPDDVEDAVKRIDEIHATQVACVDVRALIKSAPGRWACDAFSYLLARDNAGIKWRGLVIGPQRPTLATEAAYTQRVESRGVPSDRPLRGVRAAVVKHLADKDVALLVRIDSPAAVKVSAATALARAAGLCAHCGFFLVEKPGSTVSFVSAATKLETTATKLRVIMDAREANARALIQAQFEIFTLRALLQEFSNLRARAKDVLYAVTFDLRHWFHQIPLPADMAHLFRVQVDSGEAYGPRALPMGFSASPWIGQAATWTMLLGNGAPGADVETAHAEAMPPWVVLRDGNHARVGAIFVIMDGGLILTTNALQAEQWQRRIVERAKQISAHLKPGDGGGLAQLTELRPGSNAHVTFSGIEFRWRGWQTVAKDRTLLSPSSMGAATRAALTRRQVGQLLGEVLWDLRVRQIAPLDFESLFVLYAYAQPDAVGGYDTSAELGEAEGRLLGNFVDDARLHKLTAPLPAWQLGDLQIACYASDACLSDTHRRLAIVRLGDHADGATRTWAARDHTHDYIGCAELEAIVWAVADAVHLQASKGSRPLGLIIVATDSLCAKGWAECMYSKTRAEARVLLRKLQSLIGDQTRVMLPYICSESNVADAPSRTDAGPPVEGSEALLDAGCWTRTWEVVNRARAEFTRRGDVRGEQFVRMTAERRPRTDDGK